MASTKKNREVKPAKEKKEIAKPLVYVSDSKKEEPKVEEPKAEETPKPKYLHPSDLLALEVTQRDIQVSKMEMHIAEQTYKNMVLELKVMEFNLLKQKDILVQKSKEYETQKSKYAMIKNEIWKKMNLDDSAPLSYDAQTGELKL